MNKFLKHNNILLIIIANMLPHWFVSSRNEAVTSVHLCVKRRIINICLMIIANMLFANYMVQGQGKEHRIEVLTNIKRDSIQVRWAPTSAIVWQLGNKYGYIVERYTIARNGKLVDSVQKELKTLTIVPLKPIGANLMEAQAETNDYVAIVKGCIYDNDITDSKKKSGSFGALLEGKGEADARFGFALLAADLSMAAAKAHGLYIVDTEVRENEKYAYRISVAQQPKGLVIDPAVGVGALSEPTTYNPPRELGINIKNNIATLRWLINLDKGKYSAYIIERSPDGINFIRINDKPYVTAASDRNNEYAFYKDSMPNDNINYQYRIKGITAFAEEGPYSSVVGGKVTPDLSIPIIDSIGIINNQKLYLHWVLYEDLKKLAKEIYITRSTKVEGPFTNINPKPLPKNAESFIDVKPNQNNYYRIKVITTTNKTIYSVPSLGQVADTIAPDAPLGVQASIDSNGIVKINWNKNKEKDLLGYRVFKSNTTDQDYIEDANRIIKKTTYTDTVNINTLSKKVFYKIVAVDKNYNPSAFSTPVVLSRPDKIAPVPAVFTKTAILDSALQIHLQWIPSSSADDMVKQELVRKRVAVQTSNGKTTVTVLDSTVLAVDTLGKLKEYKDSKAEQGNTYIYYINTYDAVKNSSQARTGELFFETGYRDAIKDLKVRFDKKNNKIIINWGRPNVPNELHYYLVYKAMDNNTFYVWKKTTDIALEDAAVPVGSNIQYKVEAYFKNNIKTKRSAAVKLLF